MIKKLDLYVLRSFIGVLFVTFFICVFILLMQFLWKYVDEMVGKGLDISVLAEFFFYSALTLVPMALPLAILLASLMTFGNFGERLELLAMKAAGISLFRIMRPLVVTIVFICIGAFFFSNHIIPIAQSKLWTLLYSMRDKSTEIEIPENVFYDGVTDYSIYVKKKDQKKNLLIDVMIYDLSKGFENITVTVADSARLQFTDDKKYLVLTLYNGESFENLKEQEGNKQENVPYMRESFTEKQTLIEFDANFNMKNESVMEGKHNVKNIVQLEHDIDSFNRMQDSLALSLKKVIFRSYLDNRASLLENKKDSTNNAVVIHAVNNADSLFASLNADKKKEAIGVAVRSTSASLNDVSFKKWEIEDKAYLSRRHSIEWHRKFTLSFACLIFFFIGAPLGAIIRKGGLGMPVVVSVLLFIVYYIIDNAGYKFAREGVWTVTEGMWLSAAVLLPFGVFLTYKAATDSAILNADAYVAFFKRFSGIFGAIDKNKKQ
ncbi:LptF/LptG family permease [Bacteroidales bacterium OttesenSCG-928-I21]|nr:LptF/LptG family permease [Bacteroidales bacterium OttesenSCG-928-I21]